MSDEPPSAWNFIAVLGVTLVLPPAGLLLGAAALGRSFRDPAKRGTVRRRWMGITAFAVIWTLVWLALITHR